MFRTFSTLAFLALAPSAAQAEDVAVKYGDLNLANPADARILAERMHAASLTVCARQKPEPGENSFFYRSIYDTCIQRTGHAISEQVGMLPTANGAKLANN